MRIQDLIDEAETLFVVERALVVDSLLRSLNPPDSRIDESVQKLKDATPAGVLLGSGKFATELDRLDLIDEYKFLLHPRMHYRRVRG